MYLHRAFIAHLIVVFGEVGAIPVFCPEVVRIVRVEVAIRVEQRDADVPDVECRQIGIVQLRVQRADRFYQLIINPLTEYYQLTVRCECCFEC